MLPPGCRGCFICLLMRDALLQKHCCRNTCVRETGSRQQLYCTRAPRTQTEAHGEGNGDERRRDRERKEGEREGEQTETPQNSRGSSVLGREIPLSVCVSAFTHACTHAFKKERTSDAHSCISPCAFSLSLFTFSLSIFLTSPCAWKGKTDRPQAHVFQ